MWRDIKLVAIETNSTQDSEQTYMLSLKFFHCFRRGETILGENISGRTLSITLSPTLNSYIYRYKSALNLYLSYEILIFFDISQSASHANALRKTLCMH